MNLTVLKAHRDRIAQAKNFQEYQEAEVDLVDFLIAYEIEQDKSNALTEYAAKYNEWATK